MGRVLRVVLSSLQSHDAVLLGIPYKWLPGPPATVSGAPLHCPPTPTPRGHLMAKPCRGSEVLPSLQWGLPPPNPHVLAQVLPAGTTRGSLPSAPSQQLCCRSLPATERLLSPSRLLVSTAVCEFFQRFYRDGGLETQSLSTRMGLSNLGTHLILR